MYYFITAIVIGAISLYLSLAGVAEALIKALNY